MLRTIARVTFVLLISCQCDWLRAEETKTIPPPPNSAEVNTFGFETPADALNALRQKPNVHISTQGGWTIADDRSNFTVWSFTPPGHPAHPAAVKRTIVRDSAGNVSVAMSAKCWGTKAACDKLIADFKDLNDRMRKDAESKANTK